MIVLTYVDDCIIIGTSMKSIDAFIQSMQHGIENISSWQMKVMSTNSWEKRLFNTTPILLNLFSHSWLIESSISLDCVTTSFKPTQILAQLLLPLVFFIAIWLESHKNCNGNIEPLLVWHHIFRIVRVPIFLWQFIKQHVSPINQCSLTRKLSFALADTCLTLVLMALSTSLTQQKDLSAMLMLILLVDGVKPTWTMLKTSSCVQGISSPTLAVLFIELVVYKWRLLSALLRQSTLLSFNPYVMSFP